MVRKTMEELKEKGVRKVVVGYPEGVAKNHGNKLTVNFWNYSYIIKRFKEVGEELGIKVTDVGEPNTSKVAPCAGMPIKMGELKEACLSVPVQEKP
jgi:putative transposase